ncbi:LOW QUALITY PROTEIN: Eukaryotic/viral aspartic protease [Phytophthora megakarya]|uniref:Eukaryotic/viral aspartic protease n=1 Tax=Phytophthora megakarya TaxID=4795 RepID=A0A225UUI2_9STRA|nr:LOW QUALITY PROTEIN: Eukaryotic/viral aspartic protease [Phytophthora megakarya]
MYSIPFSLALGVNNSTSEEVKKERRNIAKGLSVAVPATLARTSGHDDFETPGTDDLVTTERTVSFSDSVFDPDAQDEDEYVHDDTEDKAPVKEPDLPEDAEIGGVKLLSRNLAHEFDEVSGPEPAQDDFNDDSKASSIRAQFTTKKDGHRPPINGDTPVANKSIGQCLKAMQETSKGIQLFAPIPAQQAVWSELVEDYPVYSTSTEQVTADTVSLLTAMGMATDAYPSKIVLADWSPTEAGAGLQKWKKKLKAACGSQGVGVGRQPVARAIGKNVIPANAPLPQTPKKVTKNVFASGEQSPYFQDSHMITPRSAIRQRRLPAVDSTNDSSSDDDDDPFDFYGDQTTELAQQIRELTEMNVMNSNPKIKLLQHRPLTQITTFRDWTRVKIRCSGCEEFVYEMKGTHTPPNEWCVAFQQSLRDGAVHWHRALSRKTKRTWSLLSDKFMSYYCSQFSQSASTRYYRAKRMEKENIRDYLNRFHGYARNANIKFENGGS